MSRLFLVDENNTCIELYTPEGHTKKTLKKAATK